MVRVALVDDDESYRLQVKEFLETFAKESGEEFEITAFSSGMDFITDYKPVFDIAFLDIEMPLIDGMTVARKLRLMDTDISLIFITKMPKYAVEGYDVGAVGFMVKPIKYCDFVDKIKKAIKLREQKKENSVVLKCDGVLLKMPVSQIYYVEKSKNYVIYNTAQGQLRLRGTLEGVEKELAGFGFSLCNSGCLVNLRFVSKVTATDVVINGVNLPLAFRRAKQFKQDMLKYLRGGSGGAAARGGI